MRPVVFAIASLTAACAPGAENATDDAPDPNVVHLPDGDGQGMHLSGEYELTLETESCEGDCVSLLSSITGPSDSMPAQDYVCEVGELLEDGDTNVSHDDGHLELVFDLRTHEGGVNADGSFDVIAVYGDDQVTHRRLTGEISPTGRMTGTAAAHITSDADGERALDCTAIYSITGMKRP